MSLLLTHPDRCLVDDAIVLIGVARSGTTLTGDLLGSLAELEYVYEPWLATQLPSLLGAGDLPRATAIELLRASLHEALVGQLLGRGVNTRAGDDSHFERTHPKGELERRWRELGNRREVERDTRARGLRLCVKFGNLHPFLEFFAEALPRARFLVIHRNGTDVAHSLAARGFLADDELQRGDMVMARRRLADGRLVPWWLEAGREDEFLGWDLYTRCLHLWTQLTGDHLARVAAQPRLTQRLLEIRYERLMANPARVVDEVRTWLGAGTRTQTTEQLLAGVDAARDRRRAAPPATSSTVAREAARVQRELDRRCPPL
jgi:hypothetical protein